MCDVEGVWVWKGVGKVESFWFCGSFRREFFGIFFEDFM